MTATATETEITTEWTEADVETLKTAVKMCAEAGLEWCHELKRVDLAAVWAKVEQDRAEEHAHHLRYCAERVAERTAEDPTWAVKNAKHHLVIGLHSTPEPLPPMPVMPEAMWPFLVQALENLASLPEEVVEAARDRAEERYGDNFEEWFNEEGAEFIARQALSVYGSRYGSECDPVESVLNWDENSFIKERADYLRREKEKAIKAAENSVKAATRVLTLLKGQ